MVVQGMQGEHRESLSICSTNLGRNTWWESGLYSVGYKEGLWKRSAGTNRNVVCLCDFLSSLFPQRWVLWQKDICAFFFLFKTECHDLEHTNVISALTACWFISYTCFWKKESRILRGHFEARTDIWPDTSHRNMKNKSTYSYRVI